MIINAIKYVSVKLDREEVQSFHNSPVDSDLSDLNRGVEHA